MPFMQGLDLLRQSGLRDTQPRRLVLKALGHIQKPATQSDVHAWIARHKGTVNLVTIYRVLEKFEELGLVHRHPSSGGLTLCSLPHEKGHHGFLSCHECGHVEEFTDSDLCRREDLIARRAGFRAREHVSEIVGLCASCQ